MIPYLFEWQEPNADEEGGGPVDGDGDGGGGGTSILGEEFRHKEPRDGSWPSGEHNHKEDHQEDGEVTDDVVSILVEEADEEEEHIDQHTAKTHQHESLAAKLLHHD